MVMCRSSGNLLWQIFIIMILFGANETFIHFWETWCDCNPRVFNWEIMIGRGFKNVQIYFGENVMNRFLPFLHVLVFTYTCVENLFALKTIVLEKPSKLRFIFKLRTIFKRSSNLFYSWRQWDLAKIASDLAFWTRLSLSIVYLIVVT